MQRRPVVLLHGWGGSFVSTWTNNGWVEALAANERVVVPIDLPGHGGPASHDPAAYADLAGMLETRLPTEPVDLIGFSLGAKLALQLATGDRRRFPRIVLAGVGDNLFAPEPAGEALAAVLIHGVDAETPPQITALVHYALANGGDPAALAAVLQRSPNPTFAETDLTEVGEILLVNGAEDRIAMPDERLRRALSTSRYLLLPGITHLSLPSSAGLKAAALSFLAEISQD